MSLFFKPYAALARALATVLFLAGCAGSTVLTHTSTPALVVYGSGAPAVGGSAASPSGAPMLTPPDGLTFGSVASFTIKLYALYVSTSGDCSSPVLVQDLGTAGVDKDFMTNPVLFEGTPAAATYPCVMFKMSDVLRSRPSSTFGGCTLGTEYTGDIYRAGDSAWVDVNLNPIVATGSDTVPSNDHVTIFITRDTVAALGRGINHGQLVPLGASLIVPGQLTFHVDASHAMATDGTRCGMEKPVFWFQ